MNLTSLVSETFRLNDYQKKALKKLGIITIRDILYHFPVRYAGSGEGKNITELSVGSSVVLYGVVTKLKTSKGFRSKIPMSQGILEDGSGKIKLIWFHQPYIAKLIPEGSYVKVEGKVGARKDELYISNPEIETVSAGTITGGSSLFGNDVTPGTLFPIYPESKGISSRWFYHAIQKIFASELLTRLEDSIPGEILKRYSLPALKTALIWIHTPKKESDSLASRKRFAFEEIFLIQVKNQQERKQAQSLPSWNIQPSQKDLEDFISRFPFTPTHAQQKAIEHITTDFQASHAMSRLLEGDVGSGKTFVAAATAYAVVTTRPGGKDFGNLQVAYMAPTEILATQHFESFIEFFKGMPIQIGLITSSGCKKFPSKIRPDTWTGISRTQLLKWVANGEIPILIGTHALIQKSVTFKHLAYVIIDEQHRFGTRQRADLARKDGKLPHLLSMTATPIPRTLALTLYGDLDLTILDELPKGRKEIKTQITAPKDRNAVYTQIRMLLQEGRQAYVICPRIEEPDETKENTLRARSVEVEAKRLQKEVFPEYRVGMLHGKLKPAEKERVMKEFSNGHIHILVATSVVEVGVNVPNATIILIEGAERFGLAQLHQLRGRVFRSSYDAYCYLFTESKNKETLKRLTALVTAKNGFELAEQDLLLRGTGDLYGKKQWGITDVAMEALRNIKLVEAARTEARNIVEQDSTLKDHPVLKEAVEARKHIHFE